MDAPNNILPSEPRGPVRAARPLTRRATRLERLGAGAMSLGCFAVLGVAAWLVPPAEGHGAHTQLGMPPCTWAVALGRPCPTCGMTTSFAHAADGDLAGAFATQPFGALLAILTAATFWGALHVTLTGSRLGSLAAGAIRPRTLFVAGALALGAWVYKLMTWQG